MESQSETTQTVSVLKLTILKTGDYDLWSMRMEQYLTHTDYVLWEVIVNGDAPAAVASASTGVEGHILPKTAKQKLARKNELKAKSTVLLAIPDEHLLKFHVYKDAKSLWEAIKNRNKSDLDTLSMDDLYNNLKVYKYEIKGKSSSSSNSQNVAFVSSDNSSNLEQIDAVDLEEMDLKWQVAMLTMRVKRFIKKTGRKLDFNGKEPVGFDRTKVEFYNFHRRGNFARECRAPRNQGNRNKDDPRRNALVDTSTTNALVVQDGIGSSSSSSSSSLDSEVHTCCKDCLKSYESLQKQYDQQREALNKSNLEII
ncbi:hypothetical protein Tco_0023227, partial [Tanacetum coccineum]